MSAYIPIYAQYYDDKNNIITKEISYKESLTSEYREIGIHVTIDESESSIKIKYFDSKIKLAASMVRDWANNNNIFVNFSTFIFTTDASSEWWTFQPKEATFNNYYYESQPLSVYKKRGIGIIIRAGNIPWIDNINDKKKFIIQLIPY
jgi:hypothetical protein